MRGKGIRSLSLLLFLISAGWGACYPFLPIYFKGHGLTPVQIGTLMAVSALVGAFSMSAWSALSDTIGRRRPFIALANVVFAVAMVAYALLSSFEAFLALAILSSLMAPSPIGLMTASLYEAVDPAAKATAYARYRIWGSVGWIAATSVVGKLVSAFGIRATFYLAVVLFALATLTSLGIAERGRPRAPVPKGGGRALIRERRLLTFLLIGLPLYVTVSMADLFLPLYLDSLRASPELISIAFAIPPVVGVPIILYAGRLTDRIGRKPIIVLGSAAAGLRCFLYTTVSKPVLILPINILATLTYGPMDVASTTLISDILPPEKQGIGQTLYGVMMWNVASTIGPLIGGIIAEACGLVATFYAASLLATASLLLFIVLIEERRPKT